MKKIVHLTSVHSPADVRVFVKECRSLAGAGYEVVLVAPGGADLNENGVRIRAVPKPEGRLARVTKTAWTVYRAAAEERADLYHFHDPELIPAGLLLRLAGRRVVYDAHEDVPRQIFSKHYLPVRLRRIVSRLAEAVENLAVRRFSAVVAATPLIAARFRLLNPRTVAIRNFPLPDELAASPDVPWERRDRAVAYVGGMTAVRGAEEMVRAFGLLSRGREAELRFAGDYAPPTLRDHLKGLSGWSRVRELGFLDRAGVKEVLGGVRAGLVPLHPQPNYLDALPVKMFEYMAAGLPVVASNFPLWREIVEGAKCGLLVDPHDPHAIAGAVEYLLDHPAEAEEMGLNGRRAVEDRYNWGGEETKLLALYRELLHAEAGRKA